MLICLVFALALSVAGVADVRGEGVWEPFGLDGLEVLDLESDGIYLYATTDTATAEGYEPAGVYRRYLDDPDSCWALLGFDDEWVSPLWTSVARPGWVYIGNAATGDPPGARSIYRSGDSGSSWEPAMEGISCVGFCPGVDALAGSHHSPYLLYAYLGHSQAYSTLNGGDSWECCIDELSGFASIYPFFDPAESERIWVIASSIFFDSYLYRSNDLGETWDMVYFDPLGGIGVDAFTGRAYLGNRRKILTSDDGGDTWEEVFSFPAGHNWDLIVAPWNGADVVASVWVPGADDPAVWLSRDAGESWNPHAQGLPADVEIVQNLRADIRHPGVIYAGVVTESGNRGVWRVELDDVVVLDAPPTQAPAFPSRELRVVRNPASGEAVFNVQDGATIGAGDQIIILDAAGRVVSTVDPSKDKGTFRWPGRDLAGRFVPGGTYFAVLGSDGSRSAVKFVWLGR